MTVTANQEVFDTKIEPFSFTRLGFKLDFAIVFSERDIYVFRRVSINLDAFDSTLYFPMQRKAIPASIQTDFIRRVISLLLLFATNFCYHNLFARERHTLMFLTRLKARVSPLERPHFSETLCQTFQHILKTPSIRDIPIGILWKFLKFRQMLRHFGIR